MIRGSSEERKASQASCSVRRRPSAEWNRLMLYNLNSTVVTKHIGRLLNPPAYALDTHILARQGRACKTEKCGQILDMYYQIIG